MGAMLGIDVVEKRLDWMDVPVCPFIPKVTCGLAPMCLSSQVSYESMVSFLGRSSWHLCHIPTRGDRMDSHMRMGCALHVQRFGFTALPLFGVTSFILSL